MKRQALILLFSVIVLFLIVTNQAKTLSLPTSPNSQDKSGNLGGFPPGQRPAGNIILFIGDGMGDVERMAARWVTGGLGGSLIMDSLAFHSWSRTASADNPITDSAAGATAMATGVKTNNGMIGMAPDGRPLMTILERAQRIGLAVGLVTTVQISHATPAGFSAHVANRTMMLEIADQQIAANINVLMGGGEDEFLPSTENGCYSEPGERIDGRNLIDEAINAGYTYVCDEAGLTAVSPSSTTHLLGLFADEGMVRPYTPSLDDMTQKAIDILSQDPDGFFLMVEGGQIDWAGHANDAAKAISDTVDFDAAVSVGLNFSTVVTDTLVIVTADHETGGMQLNLSSTGNPDEDGPFYMPDSTPFFVTWTTFGHTPVNVPTNAQGPLAGRLTGTYENTYIFYVMADALTNWKLFLPVINR